MKRMISNVFTRFNSGVSIQIVINVGYDFEKVVAAIEHPANISKRKRISDAKLNILNEVVYSVMSAIHSHGFTVISHRQSKKSYSYYVKFWPKTDSGERLFPIDFQFRISDHNLKQNQYKEPTTIRIINLQLGGQDYSNSVELIEAADRICTELKKGNVDVLNEYVVRGL